MEETPTPEDFDAELRMLDMWAAGEINWEDLPEYLREHVAEAVEDSSEDEEYEEEDEEEETEDAYKAASLDLIHKSNSEQRFTLGPWYIPNRYDAHGEWTDAEELQKALWDYVRTGDRGIRLQHNRDVVAGEWLEALSFPVPVTIDMKKDANAAPVTYPAGTVFLGVQWKPWAWELVKQGKIRGFSIGGAAARVEMGIPEETLKSVDGTITERVIRRMEARGADARRVPSDPVLWSRLRKSLGSDAEKVYAELGGEFKVLTPAQSKLLKLRFMNRSDAARYAANIRWQTLRGRVDKIVAEMKMVDGRPPRGPLPMPTTQRGIAAREKMMSMDGHLDFDAAVREWEQTDPEKARRTPDKKVAEAIPYAIIRKHLTPERAELHDQIIDAQFEGKRDRSMENIPPSFTFLGGGPAAGKTTMLKSGDATVPTRDEKGNLLTGKAAETNIEIGADEYKAYLPEYEALRRGKGTEEARRGAAEDAHEESSLIGKEIQKRAMKMKLDIVLDGIGDGSTEKMLEKITLIRARGYKVNGLYATIPSDLAVERAMGRGAPVGMKTKIADGSEIIGEGRYLSPKLVRAIHGDVSRVFLSIANLFDNVKLFDTSTKGAPVVIYSSTRQSREAGVPPVQDSVRWQQFTGKGRVEE